MDESHALVCRDSRFSQVSPGPHHASPKLDLTDDLSSHTVRRRAAKCIDPAPGLEGG